MPQHPTEIETAAIADVHWCPYHLTALHHPGYTYARHVERLTAPIDAEQPQTIAVAYADDLVDELQKRAAASFEGLTSARLRPPAPHRSGPVSALAAVFGTIELTDRHQYVMPTTRAPDLIDYLKEMAGGGWLDNLAIAALIRDRQDAHQLQALDLIPAQHRHVWLAGDGLAIDDLPLHQVPVDRICLLTDELPAPTSAAVLRAGCRGASVVRVTGAYFENCTWI